MRFCFHNHVRGASHEASGTVCQDYSGALEVTGARGVAYVAVVADGHGDPTCRRSDRGSRIAVEIALRGLGGLAQDYVDASDERWEELHGRLLSGTGEEGLVGSADEGVRRLIATQIVDEWRRDVYKDYAEDPIPEITEGMEQADEAQRQKAMRRLYGTTFVGSLVLPDLCMLIQQGDGCATVVFGDHRSPLARGDQIPEDPLCVGNVTTSLSDADAANRMRVAVIDGKTDPVAAVFLGTDGIDKSLAREDGASNFFSGIALDVLDRFEADDLDEDVFTDDLAEALNRVSTAGSGDDASIAGVVDLDLMRRIASSLRRERDRYELRTAIANDRVRLLSMQRRYEYYLALTPANEAEAKERDEYLASYQKLEQRIAATERDLAPGNRPQHAKEGAFQDAESELGEVDPGQDSLSTPDAVLDGAPMAEPSDEYDVDDTVDVSLETTVMGGEPSAPVAAVSMHQGYAGTPAMQVDERRRSLPLPIPLLIVFVASLLSLVVMLVLHLMNSQPTSRTQPAEEVVVATSTEETEETQVDSSHLVTTIESAIRDTFRKDEEHALSYFGIAENTEGGSFDNATVEENFAKGCMRGLDVEAVQNSINIKQDGSTATAMVEFTVVDLLAACEKYESEVYPEQGEQLRVRPLEYVYERLREEDYCQTNTAPVPPGQVELTLSYQADKGVWSVDDEPLGELVRRARETMHYVDVVDAARETMSKYVIEPGYAQTQNFGTRTGKVSSDEATSASSPSSTQDASSSYESSATDETETADASSDNAY